MRKTKTLSKKIKKKSLSKFQKIRIISKLKKSPLAKGDGIGLIIHQRGKRCQVLHVFSKSPAEKAGILKGDYLESIDGYKISIKSMLSAILLLRLQKSFLHKTKFNRKSRFRNFSIRSKPLGGLIGIDVFDQFGSWPCNECDTCFPEIAGAVDCTGCYDPCFVV